MRPLTRPCAAGRARSTPAVLRVARLALVALGVLAAPSATAKTPGTTYCYVGTCHRVLTVAETAALIAVPQHLVASYYDVPWRDRFNPSLETSSGEIFQAEAEDNVASPTLPDGTRLLIFEPRSRAAVVARVNNAGPYYSNRTLDVARGVAQRLGFLHRGVARVEVMVLSAPQPTETSYARNRRYAPVPGHLGAFDTLAAAHAAWLARPEAKEAERETKLALAAPAPPVQPGRIVVIAPRAAAAAGAAGGAALSRTATARAGLRGRVVLLPVKLRRPMALRALAARSQKARLAKATR